MTTTKSFGTTRRESHDARAFYQRFDPPETSTDATVGDPFAVRRPCRLGSAHDLRGIPNNTVALVVTSPPYFVGKDYELGGEIATYHEYLKGLTATVAACERVLEPGGRIAVNVANLGRRPYRSLCSDVEQILVGAGLLLRGEIVWQKGKGASGSCAWGSWRKATNPVLRDVTERIVIASKGRFDRAVSVSERNRRGLPYESTITAEQFMEATLDLWNVAPASAKRIGHPAPFPLELPARLIRLYTFKNDLVIDPYMGSGTTLQAAKGLARRHVGFDTEREYVDLAKKRLTTTRWGELL